MLHLSTMQGLLWIIIQAFYMCCSIGNIYNYYPIRLITWNQSLKVADDKGYFTLCLIDCNYNISYITLTLPSIEFLQWKEELELAADSSYIRTTEKKETIYFCCSMSVFLLVKQLEWEVWSHRTNKISAYFTATLTLTSDKHTVISCLLVTY